MKLRAPASSANLGPGYDVLSVALSEPYDIIDIEVEEGRGIGISVRGEYSYMVPTDPSRNSAGLVASRILSWLDAEMHVEIEIDKGIPVAAGLGSSAAPAAAVAHALDRMLSLGMSRERMVEVAGYGERASAGVEHYDNVAAATLGWFDIVRVGEGGLRVFNIRPPKGSKIFFSIVVPPTGSAYGKTGKARGLVPKNVDMKSVIWNVASASMIVTGAVLGDPRLIGEGMRDVIVEPARSGLVPGYSEVRRAALESGAFGIAISGAGPSMMAVSGSKEVARRISKAMWEALAHEGIDSMAFVAEPGEGVSSME